MQTLVLGANRRIILAPFSYRSQGVGAACARSYWHEPEAALKRG